MNERPIVHRVMHPHHSKRRISVLSVEYGTQWALLWPFHEVIEVVGPSMSISHFQSYMTTPRALPTRPNFRPTFIPKDLTAYTHVLFVAILWNPNRIPHIQAHFTLLPGTTNASSLKSRKHCKSWTVESSISWFRLYNWRFFRKNALFCTGYHQVPWEKRPPEHFTDIWPTTQYLQSFR